MKRMKAKGRGYIPARELTIELTVARVAAEVTNSELRGYISDALRTWGGSFDPMNDPLFDGVQVAPKNIRIKEN